MPSSCLHLYRHSFKVYRHEIHEKVDNTNLFDLDLILKFIIVVSQGWIYRKDGQKIKIQDLFLYF